MIRVSLVFCFKLGGWVQGLTLAAALKVFVGSVGLSDLPRAYGLSMARAQMSSIRWRPWQVDGLG